MYIVLRHPVHFELAANALEQIEKRTLFSILLVCCWVLQCAAMQVLWRCVWGPIQNERHHNAHKACYSNTNV